MRKAREKLDTETVESSALSLEGVDDVESGDGLALGVLGVGNRVSDDVFSEVKRKRAVSSWSDKCKTEGTEKGKRKRKRQEEKTKLTLKEDLEDPSGLLVDQAGDTLDTSSSSETSDGGLGDTLAVKKRK
jgi:hypothetical protein